MTLADTALNRQLEMIHLFRSPAGGPLAEALLGRHEWIALGDGSSQEMFKQLFGYATTYAITPEMMRVVRHGHDTLIANQEFVQLDMEWLPSPSGFCWFGTEYPLEMAARQWETQDGLDPDEPKRPVSGVWWLDAPVGYRTSGYQSELITGKGVMMGVIVPVEHAFVEGSDLSHIGYQHIPFDLTAWSAEVPWRGASWDEWQKAYDGGITGVSTWSGASWRWLMMVIWSLMEQRITVHHGSRNVRRRGIRALGVAAAPDFGAVQVVTLRRAETPRIGIEVPDGDDHFEYSHRFLVSGHWRWQPYGKREDQLRKLIWIAPFVKGPADKPLIIRDKVNVLKR